MSILSTELAFSVDTPNHEHPPRGTLELKVQKEQEDRRRENERGSERVG